VHRVLERVARAGDGAPATSLAEALARPAAALAWPPPATLDEWVCACARDLLREEGIALPGFERVLAFAAREPLALARELDLAAARAGWEVAGAELDARLRVAGAAGEARELLLRVDRADRRDGALRLTDYKTSRPKVAQLDADRRRAALLARIASGELLQGPAYAALAREHASPAGLGRYLHLRADAGEAGGEVAIEARDAEAAAVFATAVARALAAFDAGAFFPRLVEADPEREGEACRTCTLKEACVKGDSSARGRLTRFASEPHRAPSRAEAALLGLWRREASP
jgi:hypothetical protein